MVLEETAQEPLIKSLAVATAALRDELREAARVSDAPQARQLRRHGDSLGDDSSSGNGNGGG